MMVRGSIYSKTLEMETGITVLRSPDYRTPASMTVYLLHGLCGSHGNWLDYTLLPLYARDYNAIFIMPEAHRSFYTDMRYGQRFYQYVAEELPVIAASAFAIDPSRERTAVIGGSMGGYGALKCAFGHPERFGQCAALSPANLFLDESLAMLRLPEGRAMAAERYGAQLLSDFQACFGEAFTYSPRDDVAALARTRPSPLPRLYLACGLDDDLLAENRRYAALLDELGIPVTYVESPGGHDWYYFDAALRDALRFLCGTAHD